ncbi:hypothetical protein PSTG_09560 [Puccinia striiformis f. sp. tritici PST-78]|uniref:HAT C-terminal dimerisation domain-containing protein n=1 Tax=Puccinia striiformis f. sp. tritici PST-78 TaxID=1165861 RepID=A0A0L0VCW7_9BASI|nr:hypothetical protein PSTG_09560 [Puccinia striiformis f. sp. tritici PST-78]
MTRSRQTTPSGEPPTNRQSTRVRTPLSRPGFIQTHTDSRRTLEAPPASPLDSHSANAPSTRSQGPQAAKARTKKPTKSASQSQSTTGSSVDQVIDVESTIDIVQDSDEENAKAEKNSKVDTDEFDSVKLHYHTPYKADDQVKEGALTYKCRWCPKSVRVNGSTDSNLKTHRDGAINRNRLRKSCPGRGKAVIQGANLPISSDEKAAAKEKKTTPSGTLTAYVTKGKFDINTMNKILLFWIIRQSLPWSRFGDYLLGVAFDYSNPNSKVFSRTWAAFNARKLYLSLQFKVISDIKKSDSKIGLIADVWTTKGNHKAFIGISVCYINKKWEYVSQHLSLKYVSWHHNGKYLAAPFANVLAKHGLHNQITLTTDSGSNNFTMAKELARILRIKSGDFSHYEDHHPRCFCHVLALILGAGLRSLNLKQPLQSPKTVPDYFPTLESIAEVDEDEAGPHVDIDILQLDDVDDNSEVDPDDAENVDEDADNCFGDPSNVPTGGIGYTLLKVNYICRRVSSSSARRADFKLVAADKKHKGSLIPGYGIRWNVAYDCWQRAYAARRVIDQLLEDETDKFAGKSAAGHYYKGYEISKKEWENVNSLTIVLEEFLALTLSMEDDGPTASMVLYKYRQLIDSLEKKKIAPEFAALQGMFDPMIKVAKKYLNITLGCTPILLATIVHPAWRLSLIKDKFPEYEDVALSLVQDAFKAKQEAHNQMLPEPAAPDSNGDDSDEEEFNYYPVKNVSSQDTNELKKYLDGAYPLGKKGDPLNWWMIHQSEFPRLASVARDALACSATSATVERTFSAAADVCAPGRHSLAAPTIERCVSSHIWLQKGMKADGEFSDCQSVIDAASANPKFATQVANKNRKIKAKKIKNVANPKSK